MQKGTFAQRLGIEPEQGHTFAVAVADMVDVTVGVSVTVVVSGVTVTISATVTVMVEANADIVKVSVTIDVGRTVDEVRLRHSHAADTTSQA